MQIAVSDSHYDISVYWESIPVVRKTLPFSSSRTNMTTKPVRVSIFMIQLEAPCSPGPVMQTTPYRLLVVLQDNFVFAFASSTLWAQSYCITTLPQPNQVHLGLQRLSSLVSHAGCFFYRF